MGIAAPSTPTANPAAVKARWNMVAAVAKHEVALKGMVPLRAELGDCWESAHREARGYFRVDQSSSGARSLSKTGLSLVNAEPVSCWADPSATHSRENFRESVLLSQ